MKTSEIVMENFLNELENHKFKKDNFPNNGPKFSEEYANKTVNSYREFLDKNFIAEVEKW